MDLLSKHQIVTSVETIITLKHPLRFLVSTFYPTVSTPTFGPSVSPTSVTPSTSPSLSPSCTVFACYVGDHPPDSSFSGWYYRTELISEGRPVWRHKDHNDMALAYFTNWVILPSIMISIEKLRCSMQSRGALC